MYAYTYMYLFKDPRRIVSYFPNSAYIVHAIDIIICIMCIYIYNTIQYYICIKKHLWTSTAEQVKIKNKQDVSLISVIAAVPRLDLQIPSYNHYSCRENNLLK